MSGIEAATKKREDFFDQFEDVIRTATKFKAAMLKKGITRARTQCPRCNTKAPEKPSGATLYGAIAGPRKHFHMSCQNGCGMAMME
jgi:hypothetical protein